MPGADEVLRQEAVRIAKQIAGEAEREFKHARLEVEPVYPDEDIEVDAYLWLDSDASEEEVQELWSWVRDACEQAWRRHDVKIVWRMKRKRAGTLADSRPGEMRTAPAVELPGPPGGEKG